MVVTDQERPANPADVADVEADSEEGADADVSPARTIREEMDEQKPDTKNLEEETFDSINVLDATKAT